MRNLSIAVILLAIGFLFLIPLKSVLAGHPLIVEVQIAGDINSNDFIKIYNPTNNDLDISGYRLRKRTSTGRESSIRVFPKESLIKAKKYFLWANSKDNFHLNVGANVWSATTLAKNNSIALLNPENVILDALAWGKSQNPFIESLPFPKNPESNQKLERKKIGQIYQDTNNNVNDFRLNSVSKLKTETHPKEGSQTEIPQLEIKPEPQLESHPESLIYPSGVVINEILPTPRGSDAKDTPTEIKSPSQIIDINTASVKELQKIVGIGPVLAQKIIDARPFYSLDELTKVSGIGPKTLADIKKQSLVWVDPELEPPKIEKTESPETQMATVAAPFKQGGLGGGIPKSLSVFLISLAVALFSAVIILILKKKLKTKELL